MAGDPVWSFAPALSRSCKPSGMHRGRRPAIAAALVELVAQVFETFAQVVDLGRHGRCWCVLQPVRLAVRACRGDRSRVESGGGRIAEDDQVRAAHPHGAGAGPELSTVEVGRRDRRGCLGMGRGSTQRQCSGQSQSPRERQSPGLIFRALIFQRARAGLSAFSSNRVPFLG